MNQRNKVLCSVLSLMILGGSLASAATTTRARKKTTVTKPAAPVHATYEPSATTTKVWSSDEGSWAAVPDFPGVQMKLVNGNPQTGPSDIYLEVPAGNRLPFHWHSATESVYMERGTLELQMWDNTQTRVLNGMSYFQAPPRMIHRATCTSSEDCYLFVHSGGPFDIHIVNDQGLATPGSPSANNTYPPGGNPNNNPNNNPNSAGNYPNSNPNYPNNNPNNNPSYPNNNSNYPNNIPTTAANTGATVTIPQGTTLSVRIGETIDTNVNRIGDVFHATLENPVTIDNRLVLPRGTQIEGRVAESKSSGKFQGKANLALILTRIIDVNNTYDIQTNEVNRESASRGQRTAGAVGGGAALGAIIGAIAGGGRGAAIGAGAGAAAGTGVEAATGSNQIKIPAETMLEFSLTSPVTLTPIKSPSRTRLP